MILPGETFDFNEVVGARSPHSLMDAAVAVYGEEARVWTGEEAAGFAKIHGLASVLAARREATATSRPHPASAGASTTLQGEATAEEANP